MSYKGVILSKFNKSLEKEKNRKEKRKKKEITSILKYKYHEYYLFHLILYIKEFFKVYFRNI